MPVLHQSTYIFNAGIWSLGKNVKMFQPKYWNAMLAKVNLTKKKDLYLSSTEKLAKQWWMHAKSN